MNFKTTYVLFGLFVGLLLLFGIAQLTGMKPNKDKSSFALPSLNDSKNPLRTEDIERVEIVRSRPKEEKLVFFRGEQGWQSKDPAVRLDSYVVDRLVDQIKNARKEEKADVTTSLSQFGLDHPAAVVTLTKKGDGKEYTLNVGNESVGGDKAVVYVTTSDKHTPLAVRKTSLDNLFKSLSDFRTKDLLGASAVNTSLVSLQETGKEPVILEKGTENRWHFQKPPYGDADYDGDTTPGAPGQKGITGVRELVDAIGALKVGGTEDFVAEGVSAADLASKYGLEKGKPAKLRIEVKRSPGGLLGSDDKKAPVTEALLIGKKDEKADDKYYARFENEDVVVKLPAKNVDALLKVVEQPQILRNRDLVQVDATKTDAIDIKNDSGLLKLRKTGQPETWKLYAGGAKPRGAEETAVQDVLAALNARRQVKDFPPASRTDAELGLDKPRAEIAIWTEGIAKDDKKDEAKKDEAKKEDKKDEAKKDDKKDEAKKDEAKKEEKKDPDAEPKLKSDKPKVRLVFGKREGDVVYIRREEGEEKARLAVPVSLLDKVNAGPLAYTDRSLPSFGAEADVLKLTLVRDGQTYELTREKKDDKSPASWKFTQPKDLAGRTADVKTIESILGDLRSLTADKLLVEKASDADLEKYGLKSPGLKVTVTTKKGDKPEDFVYTFGKETEDKSGRYAKQGERDVVFQVRPNSIAALQGELLDPTILHFDPAKVKSIKLLGWEKLYQFTLHLELERKSGDPKSWTVKEGPKGFQLDDRKVEAFITELANLRAERFVVHKTGPKPEQKLGKNDRALEIEITLDGEKAPLTLTLGAPEGTDKKSYFAQSSTVPGDVFLVSQARFQKLLDEGAKFFTKEAVAAQ